MQNYSSKVKKETNTNFPKKRENISEFKKGSREYVICPECSSVYYHKSWHRAFEGDKHFTENKNVKFAICPADKMIKNKQFEGQIILENVPEILRGDLFNLIENMGERAFKHDPMDRIISIKDKKDAIEVLTTENQLAVRIAKKIQNIFGKRIDGRGEIKYSHGEDPARIFLRFS